MGRPDRTDGQRRFPKDERDVGYHSERGSGVVHIELAQGGGGDGQDWTARLLQPEQ